MNSTLIDRKNANCWYSAEKTLRTAALKNVNRADFKRKRVYRTTSVIGAHYILFQACLQHTDIVNYWTLDNALKDDITVVECSYEFLVYLFVIIVYILHVFAEYSNRSTMQICKVKRVFNPFNALINLMWFKLKLLKHYLRIIVKKM